MNDDELRAQAAEDGAAAVTEMEAVEAEARALRFNQITATTDNIRANTKHTEARAAVLNAFAIMLTVLTAAGVLFGLAFMVTWTITELS